MPLAFSSKAATLLALKDVLSTAQIPSSIVFTVGDWRADKKACINLVKHNSASGPWIVRSSCGSEDTKETSSAGKFLSISNVSDEKLHNSIEKVIESYGIENQKDELLIQPMLTDVIRSGVIFSHDPNTCAPYQVINWVEGSDTTAVTSGLDGRVWQQAALSPLPAPPILKPMISLLNELLSHFGSLPIDCEFAVTNATPTNEDNEVLWLLQARPLILNANPESAEQQALRLRHVAKKLETNMQPHPFVMGNRTLYGVMPDWNPAEIIGVRPKALSLSLYRELVTDSIWAYQRHNYGYRNLRSFPLMPHFFGLPYIDVRLSLNSFVPSDLDDELAARLVDHYLDCLQDEPALHDKVEFEIVLSCYTLDLPNRLDQLRNKGFTGNDCSALTRSLRHLTNRIMHIDNGLWQSDVSKLKILNSRRELLRDSNVDQLTRIYWLLEDAKRYGTLPFAGLARVGFIAVQFLRSFVSIGLFSSRDYESFLNGVSSVTGQLTRDRQLLDKECFLERYGHLRPGTYNIESLRYDEAPEKYFAWDEQPVEIPRDKTFAPSSSQIQELSRLLKTHKLELTAAELLEFIKASIELREQAKFDFTRNLSDVLSLIVEVGEQYGFSREDLAYCDISVFREMYTAAGDPRTSIRSGIRKGKELFSQSSRIVLPPLISKPQDVWAFEWPEALPTFISHKRITALVGVISAPKELEGRIICIPNADPGFDWLFAYQIGGLVTAWGGPNSHMEIRAGELGIPAVIGTGEILYQRLSQAKRLHLNCSDKRIEVLV